MLVSYKVPDKLVRSFGVELVTWVGYSGAERNEFLGICDSLIGEIACGLTVGYESNIHYL